MLQPAAAVLFRGPRCRLIIPGMKEEEEAGAGLGPLLAVLALSSLLLPAALALLAAAAGSEFMPEHLRGDVVVEQHFRSLHYGAQFLRIAVRRGLFVVGVFLVRGLAQRPL